MKIILHNIRSLHNVGSIFRTADALGIEKIYLCGITPKPIDEFGRPRPQFAKVSLGAEKYIQWEYYRSAVKFIDKLKKSPTDKKYKIFAIEQGQKSVPYHKVRLSALQVENSALILGSETKGLPPPILKQADKILEIPMRGKIIRQAGHPRCAGQGKESLNVAVAFGIVAFHLVNNTRR